MKKTIIISIVLIVAVVAGYFLFFGGSAEGYTFRFDNVGSGDMSVYVTATGTLNAVTTVQVGTQVSGIVSKLYADFNSIVKKGQIIARKLNTTKARGRLTGRRFYTIKSLTRRWITTRL